MKMKDTNKTFKAYIKSKSWFSNKTQIKYLRPVYLFDYSGLK